MHSRWLRTRNTLGHGECHFRLHKWICVCGKCRSNPDNAQQRAPLNGGFSRRSNAQWATNSKQYANGCHGLSIPVWGQRRRRRRGEGQWKRDLIKFNYLHYCNRRPAVKLWRIRTFIIIIKYLKGRHKFSLVNIYFALPPPIFFVPTLIRGDLSHNANESTAVLLHTKCTHTRARQARIQ